MKSFFSSTLGAAVGAAFVFLAAGYLGAEDYRDEVRQAVVYCEMVRAGYWPDYNGTAGACGEVYAEAVRLGVAE